MNNLNYSNTSNAKGTNNSGEDCSLEAAHGISLLTTNLLVCIIGSLGNLLVCVAVGTNPRLRRSSNFLLFSLATADLIVTMVCEPIFVAVLVKKTFFSDCALSIEVPYLALSRLSCTASVAHMAAISVDRFIAVVFPLHHRYVIGNHAVTSMLVMSWTLPISVLVIDRFVPESFPKGFLALGMFTLFYLTIFMSYSLIVIALLKNRKKRNKLRARSQSGEDNFRVEVRVALTLAIVISVFTACWIPFFFFFTATGKLSLKRYGSAHMWIRTLALSNSAMNFLIYGLRLESFRESFVAILRTVFKKFTALCTRKKISHTVEYRVQ